MLFVVLTCAYSLIGTIQCENKTLGYKKDFLLNKLYEERVFDNSTLFQVKTRTINFPPNGMVSEIDNIDRMFTQKSWSKN